MRRILCLLLTVLLLAALAVPASAEDTTNLTLRLRDGQTPVSGAVFEIYLVGTGDDDGNLVLTGSFADYPVDPNAGGEDGSSQAAALYGFARKDGLIPDAVASTDNTGMAHVNNLKAGLYLIAGQPLVQGAFRYHTEPQLILLPQKDPISGLVMRNPVLQIKFSKEPYTPGPVSRKVLKIWDDGEGEKRPASVTVHLLKDGGVYSTVTLTAANQWRHTWEELDPGALWQITEDVPEGYTVKVEQEGTTFLLTNSTSRPPDPTDPTDPSDPTKPTDSTTPTETRPPVVTDDRIPQTGSLWWPRFLMAGLGLLLLLAGWFLGRKGRGPGLLGILLLAGALLSVTQDVRQQKETVEVSRTVMTRLELPEEELEPVPGIQPTVAPIPDYQRNPHMDMPEQILDGTAYIGTLEIPVLELDLPVASETTGENLQKAPCRYSGSPYTENLVLGAHNYDGHFGRLKKLSYGDEIRVTDLDGNAFTYRVADIEILQPEQLEDLLGGGWPLTLYTCTPGGQSRVTVRCEIA